jgi:hypothetical protein
MGNQKSHPPDHSIHVVEVVFKPGQKFRERVKEVTVWTVFYIT